MSEFNLFLLILLSKFSLVRGNYYPYNEVPGECIMFSSVSEAAPTRRAAQFYAMPFNARYGTAAGDGLMGSDAPHILCLPHN